MFHFGSVFFWPYLGELQTCLFSLLPSETGIEMSDSAGEALRAFLNKVTACKDFDYDYDSYTCVPHT